MCHFNNTETILISWNLNWILFPRTRNQTFVTRSIGGVGLKLRLIWSRCTTEIAGWCRVSSSFSCFPLQTTDGNIFSVFIFHSKGKGGALMSLWTAAPRTTRKEGNVLFNDALNSFYLRLYGVRHMVKDHTDIERGNPLPPHRLLLPISSKCYFICTIPQTG